MDHPCSHEGPKSNRIECTKFCEACTRFCERCTKGSKVRSEVRIDPQSLPYGFPNEIMGPRWKMRVSETIGCEVQNLTKDVPNFVNDVPSIPKCILRLGSTPNHFLMGSKTKSWAIHVQMRDPEAMGSHVPNLMTDVQNFVKNVPNFVNDVPKCIP